MLKQVSPPPNLSVLICKVQWAGSMSHQLWGCGAQGERPGTLSSDYGRC